jgi:hypothetical protein
LKSYLELNFCLIRREVLSIKLQHSSHVHPSVLIWLPRSNLSLSLLWTVLGQIIPLPLPCLPPTLNPISPS